MAVEVMAVMEARLCVDVLFLRFVVGGVGVGVGVGAVVVSLLLYIFVVLILLTLIVDVAMFFFLFLFFFRFFFACKPMPSLPIFIVKLVLPPSRSSFTFFSLFDGVSSWILKSIKLQSFISSLSAPLS